MALDELVDQLDKNSTTRRSIVKTGVKIGYGAPLVAATFKLNALGASAQGVSENCPCFSDCGDNPACFCLTDVDNNAFCSNDFFCVDSTTCSVNSDCPAGFICQGGRCPGNCGASVCVPPCGTILTSADVTSSTVRQTNRGK